MAMPTHPLEHRYRGEHPIRTLAFLFHEDRGRIVLDRSPGEWGDLSPTLMNGMHEGLDIGLDRRAPVDWDLRERHGVFRYGGNIEDVIIESGAFAPDSPFGKG